MNRYVLYIYADGSDLEDVEVVIQTELSTSLAQHDWVLEQPVLVNQRHEPDKTMGPEDLPDWDLGVSVSIPPVDTRPTNWLEDVNFLVGLFVQLSEKVERDFVLGIQDTLQKYTDDLVFLGRTSPNIGQLRALLSVLDETTRDGEPHARARLAAAANSFSFARKLTPVEVAGRYCVLLALGLIVSVSIAGTLLFVHQRGTDRLPVQLVRFALTIALAVLVYSGKPWARWLTVALLGGTGVVSIVLSRAPVVLALSLTYLTCSVLLLLPASGQFLSRQAHKRES